MSAPIRVAEICAAIASSGQFDADWYLARNPDVAVSGMDPILHYVLYGEGECRDPSPNFCLRRHMRLSESCGNIFCDNVRGAKTEIKQEIPVVFSVNDSFIPLLSVAIASIIRNSDTNNMYRVYIFYNDVTEEKLKTLVSMSTPNVVISTVRISSQLNELLKHAKTPNHLTIETWFRLLIPILLKQYEKVIYLDCDLIVNNDISDLYNENIASFILGAIPDSCLMPSALQYRQDELSGDAKYYFNAGVLLFNIDLFSQNGYIDKCLDLANSERVFPTADQDVLNIVCEGQVKLLPMKWNWQWTFLVSEGYRYVDRDFFARMCMAFKKPAIVHFTNPSKPWNYNDGIFAAMFWRYARYSPFFETLVRNCPYNLDKEIWPKLETEA